MMASFDSPLKTSPKGSKSPQVSSIPRPDSSGTLKTTIFLGRNPTIVQKGPFYLCKDLPGNFPFKFKQIFTFKDIWQVKTFN